MREILVRDVERKDAARLLEIYAYYVENTAITFEYDVPSLLEFENRIEHTKKRYPYIVAECDGVIQGYAYAGPFKGRAAYDWSCETTVYVNRSMRHDGLGKRLYEALEDNLKAMGILNLYACIAYPETPDEYLDDNSMQFHMHLGFAPIGEFHACGYKFKRWYNMVWMEKTVGTHLLDQPDVKWPS